MYRRRIISVRLTGPLVVFVGEAILVACFTVVVVAVAVRTRAPRLLCVTKFVVVVFVGGVVETRFVLLPQPISCHFKQVHPKHVSIGFSFSSRGYGKRSKIRYRR